MRFLTPGTNPAVDPVAFDGAEMFGGELRGISFGHGGVLLTVVRDGVGQPVVLSPLDTVELMAWLSEVTR